MERSKAGMNEKSSPDGLNYSSDLLLPRVLRPEAVVALPNETNLHPE